jgi:hypothetical protein
MGKNRKRTKSQVSPDAGNPLPEQKRTAMDQSDQLSPSTLSNVGNGSFLHQLQQPYIPNMMGSYIQSPNAMPMTPPPQMPQSQTQHYNNPVSPIIDNTVIMSKLEAIDLRLRKLDSIEEQVLNINSKISSMNHRISSLESKMSDSNKTILELEKSRTFDSQVCNEISSKQKNIDKILSDEKQRCNSMQGELHNLKQSNSKLEDDIVDLQARSMRDNLLFFNIPEETLANNRRDENCSLKILNFCENNLKMSDAKKNIKFDRAHRLGKFLSNKTRPIVVKCSYPPDKALIKQQARMLLKNTDYRVSDQYPDKVREKRKALIPELIKAREEGKDAIISFDRLIIRGQRSTSISPDDTHE